MWDTRAHETITLGPHGRIATFPSAACAPSLSVLQMKLDGFWSIGLNATQELCWTIVDLPGDISCCSAARQCILQMKVKEIVRPSIVSSWRRRCHTEITTLIVGTRIAEGRLNFLCLIKAVTSEHVEQGNVPKTNDFSSTMLDKENFFHWTFCFSISIWWSIFYSKHPTKWQPSLPASKFIAQVKWISLVLQQKGLATNASGLFHRCTRVM